MVVVLRTQVNGLLFCKKLNQILVRGLNLNRKELRPVQGYRVDNISHIGRSLDTVAISSPKSFFILKGYEFSLASLGLFAVITGLYGYFLYTSLVIQVYLGFVYGSYRYLRYIFINLSRIARLVYSISNGSGIKVGSYSFINPGYNRICIL